MGSTIKTYGGLTDVWIIEVTCSKRTRIKEKLAREVLGEDFDGESDDEKICYGEKGLCKQKPHNSVVKQRWRNTNDWPVEGVWDWFYPSGSLGGTEKEKFEPHEVKYVTFSQWAHTTELVDVIKLS